MGSLSEAIKHKAEEEIKKDTEKNDSRMTGQEAHEKSKELLIALNKFFLSLPDKETISTEDLLAIDLNADQIQCIAEEIRYWSRYGEIRAGLVEPQ